MFGGRRQAARPASYSNRYITMGLYLLPHPPRSQSELVPIGKMHRDLEPCPFERGHHPIGVLGICCSFHANRTAFYLVAFGYGELATELHVPKSPIEAGEFAEVLRAALTQVRKGLEKQRRRGNTPADKPLDKHYVRLPSIGGDFPLEQALLTLEAVATWHAKVSKAGFGVHAWP